MSVLALSGGVGGAKLVRGLSHQLPAESLSIIANTGDDGIHSGLLVCPDIDTLIYTLSGQSHPEQGWGLAGESWQVFDRLGELGGETWFRLGDKDIATHLFRAEKIQQGLSLTQVTRALCLAHNIAPNILPMCDELFQTKVITQDGRTLDFHEYFVKEQCGPRVESIAFIGNPSLSSDVEAAIMQTGALIICPSNPFLSIDPILQVPGLQSLITERIEKRLVVSPIINGQAIKGPTAKLMQELALPVTNESVAKKYQSIATHMIIDNQDAVDKNLLESMGLKVLVTNTLMQTLADKKQLASDVLGFLGVK
ncbi:MAG: 2-phospho-L-lactate transferase [Cellvibrionales bacterium]|nr:2-phospho-L-lactate transferase [Cellvibrionales bacterium]